MNNMDLLSIGLAFGIPIYLSCLGIVAIIKAIKGEEDKLCLLKKFQMF